MKKIFLTGATGFIGSHLSNYLVSKGYEVFLLIRPGNRAFIPNRPSLPQTGIKLIKGSLEEPDTYQDYLKEIDVLINLAADYRVGLANSKKERAKMYQTNVNGALQLFQTAHKALVPKLIQVSSTAALGETKTSIGDEDHQHNSFFHSYYEETKHIIHKLLKSRQKKGWPIIFATLGGVFGSGDNSDLNQAINNFFAKKLPFQPKSESRFQLCRVDHICKAFELLIEAERDIEDNYLFVGEDFSMSEIFALSAQISKEEPPKVISKYLLILPAFFLDLGARLGFKVPFTKETLKVMDGSKYIYSAAKAKEQLGWHCGEVSQELKDHLKNIYLSYKEKNLNEV